MAHVPSTSGVPVGAVFDATLNLWELAAKSVDGTKHGEARLFRDDGTLFFRCVYENGRQNGPFVAFQRNGEVLQEGTFVDGKYHGDIVAYASDTKGADKIRACCVPAAAQKLRSRYEHGRFVYEQFYDRDGRPLLEDGSLRPDRPSGVPETAELDASLDQWVLGDRGAGTEEAPGFVRFFALDGALVEEAEFARGGKVLSRIFDRDGIVTRESRFLHTPTGADLHGAFQRRFSPDLPSPYLEIAVDGEMADPRVAEECGSFDRGHPSGVWSLLDAAGETLRAFDLGPVIDERGALASVAFADDDGAVAEHFEVLADRLGAEGRLREAICAEARGAARSGNAARLSRRLASDAMVLQDDVRQKRGERLASGTDTTVATALDGLVTGADAPSALQALGAVLPREMRAALDLVEASLLLAPERTMARLTRALIRIERGDDLGALRDADALAGESPDGAEGIKSYVGASFPELLFWPSRDPVVERPSDTPPLDVPIAPAQSVEAVRRVMGVYATRLLAFRSAILTRLDPADARPWLPPNLAELLPEGPLLLEHHAITIDQEKESGETETIESQIDERPVIDGISVCRLMHQVRADWSALTWLCWSVGLDRVALPNRICPPSEVGAAAQRVVARSWRAQDRLTTGGIIARARSIPGFLWEGLDIDDMPRHLVEIAVTELLEVRSMFLWLLGPDELSPFQSDLRRM